MFKKLKRHLVAHKNPYSAGLAVVVIIALFFGLKATGISQLTGSLVSVSRPGFGGGYMVISPLVKSVYKIGDRVDIKWVPPINNATYTATLNPVNNKRARTSTIASGLTTPSYTWTIPASVVIGNYQIRVVGEYFVVSPAKPSRGRIVPQIQPQIKRSQIWTMPGYFTINAAAAPTAPVSGQVSLVVNNTSTNSSLVANNKIELMAFDATAVNGDVKISQIRFGAEYVIKYELYRNGTQIMVWGYDPGTPGLSPAGWMGGPVFLFDPNPEVVASGTTNHYKLMGLLPGIPDQTTFMLNSEVHNVSDTLRDSGLVTNAPVTGLPIRQILTKPTTQTPTAPAVCGDGIMATSEVCDDANTVTETTCPTGQTSCIVCNSTCTAMLNLTGAAVAVCGNGLVEVPETCDGPVPAGATCATATNNIRRYGTLSCSSNCTLNTSQCLASQCGNGMVEAPETCDDGNTVSGDGCSSTCAIEVVSGGLTVSKSDTPFSETYVKGEDNVPALGINLTATGGDITVHQLMARVYANAQPSPWSSPTGDMAYADIADARLYAGNDLLYAGPGRALADKNNNNIWDAGEFYKFYFNSLDLRIAQGTTKNLTIKLRLNNTSPNNYHLALDMVPAEDIVASNASQVGIVATGPALNGGASHNPVITVLTNGSLSIVSEGNPAGGNVTAGSTQVMVAKYRLSALYEPFTVNKLTVINDSQGIFDQAVDTPAVAQIIIKYRDVNGVSQTRLGTLAGGAVTFSDLGLFAPKDSNVYLEIFADISTLQDVGEGLYGQTFRLGIQDTNNSIQTLQAIGQYSSMLIENPTISNSSSVNTFTVVSPAELSVIQNMSSPRTLSTGSNNELLSFYLTTNSGGTVNISQITFDVVGNVIPSKYTLSIGQNPLFTSTSTPPVFNLGNLNIGGSTVAKLKADLMTVVPDGATITTTLNPPIMIMADQRVTGQSFSQTNEN